MEQETAQAMTNGKGKPVMDYLIDYMKKNPKADFREARDAAAKVGLTVYPIVWGRAQLLLGRVKAGEGKGAVRKAAARRAEAEAAADPGAVPVVGRRRMARAQAGSPRASGAPLRLPVPAGMTPQELRDLVDAINGGAQASLTYRGDGWTIEITP